MTRPIDETNAGTYVDAAMEERLSDITDLLKLSGGDIDYEVSAERAASLGIDDGDYVGDQADERLNDYPLCVEVTTTFEIVLGCGGPDDRLLIECDVDFLEAASSAASPTPPDSGSDGSSIATCWDGSAERVLGGVESEVAEAFARRVIPELG